MSILAVGVSHHSASLELLERLSLDPEQVARLSQEVASLPFVSESAVLATCHRVEVYAEVEKFHSAVTDITELLARHSRMAAEELTGALRIHYEDSAVSYLFSVACGLDSMVVGESQVLGQVREALRYAQEAGSAGLVLNELFQQALRIGKRVRAETDLDHAGRSVVSVGLTAAGERIGGLAGRDALVVGAGAMGAMAVRFLADAGAGSITIVNRTEDRARALAEAVGARLRPWGELTDALGHADVIVSGTGSRDLVVHAADLAVARPADRPVVVVDMALPRDVDPAIQDLPNVYLIDLDVVAASAGVPHVADVETATSMVAAATTEFASWLRSRAVAPTVAALRARAASVVQAELTRLSGRLGAMEPRVLDEVANTVSRVVDKLLHEPTIRAKELAGAPEGDQYADVLRRLFDLEPEALDLLTRPLEPRPTPLEAGS